MKLHTRSQQLSSNEELSLFPSSSAADLRRAPSPLEQAATFEIRRQHRTTKLSVQPCTSSNGHSNYVTKVAKPARPVRSVGSSVTDYNALVAQAVIREPRAQLVGLTAESHSAVCTTPLNNLTFDRSDRSQLRMHVGQSPMQPGPRPRAMALVEEEPSSPVASSPSFRRARQNLTDRLERFCSSPSSQTSQSSSVSSQSFNQELSSSMDLRTRDSLRVDLKRLRRIEAVRVEHSIRKHDHRYYVVHVYLRSARTPIYCRDPDYALDIPYASFFSLRDTVLRSSSDHAKHCGSCSLRSTLLRDHHESIHDLRRLVRLTRAKERRLEEFLHWLLPGSGDDTTAPGSIDMDTAWQCGGCAATSRGLAAFLKRQYQPSTGII